MDLTDYWAHNEVTSNGIVAPTFCFVNKIVESVKMYLRRQLEHRRAHNKWSGVVLCS